MRRNAKTKREGFCRSVLDPAFLSAPSVCRSHRAPLCFRGSSAEGQLNGLQSSLNPAAFMPITNSTGQWAADLLGVGWGGKEGGSWQFSPLPLLRTSAQRTNAQALKALVDRYFDCIFFFRMITTSWGWHFLKQMG